MNEMKKSILFVFIMILTHSSFAGYRVYCGGNYSKFNTKISQPRLGGSFGIDKTWDTQHICIACGLSLIFRNTYQEGNTMVIPHNQGYYFDALFSVGYLVVPEKVFK